MTTVTIGGRAGDTFSGMQDAWLLSSVPDTNFSTAADASESIVLRPDLTGISGPLTVTNAFWTMFVDSGDSSTRTINITRVLRVWIEAEATWNSWKASNAWTTAGALGSGTDRAASISASMSYPGGFSTGDLVSTGNTTLIADLQNYFNGTITDLTWIWDGFGGSISFSLPANGTAAQRPELTIVYTAGGGGPSLMGTSIWMTS